MTLSDENVIKFLNKNFVSGYRNIKGKTDYAGSSNTHKPTDPAMGVYNCSGHHNVQMFFMTHDGKVLHCLPGYWAPKHLLHEAELALSLAKVYYAKGLSVADRNEKFLDLHLVHALEHKIDVQHASKLQPFDKMDLEKREETDFKREGKFTSSGLKTADQVVHERMAERILIPFEKFDVDRSIDMGLKRYKYDYGLDKEGKYGGKDKDGKEAKEGETTSRTGKPETTVKKQ